ncbi:N-lysine methyltransferase SMYD2-like [Strongylocentrotus purpuratus]|uniref:SET domain-containing protein n=1 Tax=Strongylocentrotus purpuratus TaxID=7668 RepID=A0A7M7PM01_STRPU|nr:N-lysine methyltransferase SMYD2-like [Strongylocentrotus purpuratus]
MTFTNIERITPVIGFMQAYSHTISTLKKCSRCKYVSYCNKSCQFVQLVSQIIQKQRRYPPCTHDDEDYFPTTVDQLESHLKYARKDNIESLLCELQQLFEEDVLPEPSSLLNMYGAINCNGFSILDNDLNGIAPGIYLRASMVNHSCDPNCQVISDGRKLQLRTVKDVTEGEECTISYVDLMDPTKERQAELEKRYHFTCKCVKCIKEINPDDGLGELELRDLHWTKVLQLCAPYLKLDSSNNLLANYYLLVRLRQEAIKVCVHIQAWDKYVEMGQLNIESLRYHYGPYSAMLGLHLLDMGNKLLEMGRLREARKYLTEAKSVLEITHGPQHSFMMTPYVQKLLDL